MPVPLFWLSSNLTPYLQDIFKRVLLELAYFGALVAFVLGYTTYFDCILLEKASCH